MYLENGMTVRSRYDFAMIRARRRRLTGGRNDDRAERRKKYNRKEVNTMPRLSKKVKDEWAFFLHPQTGRRTYNEICRSCIHECKQSFRALLLECPKYESKRAVRYALKKAPTDDKGDENSAARKSYYPLRESGLQGGKSKKHAPF